MGSVNPVATAAPTGEGGDRQSRRGAVEGDQRRTGSSVDHSRSPPRSTSLSFFGGGGVSDYQHQQHQQQQPQPHHHQSHTTSVSLFDPLLQQLGDGKFLKEKSSLELVDDDGSLGLDHKGRMRSESGASGSGGHGSSYAPAYSMFASRIPPSLSNDGSSHSGPSRASTPFYGDTDYDSAYDTDGAAMAMARKGSAVGALAYQPDERDGRDRSSLKSIRTVQSGGLGWKESAGSPHNSLDYDRDSKSASMWTSWLGSVAPRGHLYQRLQNTDSAKSPLVRHHYRARSANRQPFDPSMLSSPRRLLLWGIRSLQDLVTALHPLKLLAALLFVAGFVASTTLLIIYILNPDKEPWPWRSFCAEQQPFPHTLADSLAPVDVFVGVMTVDSHFERRSVIRSTYGAYTRPIDPVTGLQSTNVQLKFILGRPSKKLERRIALEMEMFNDIVVLWDMEENMAGGKSYRYFQWATENATVPILRPRSGQRQLDSSTGSTLPQEGTVKGANDVLYDVSWKLVDYVVKADDDAFIALDELERHLRVAPRKLTYWGYLIKNWFMGGEAYALSMDVVQWIATSPWVAAHSTGKEDTATAKWLKQHPEKSKLNYVSERCWIYDHPKSGTAYAHGYLFPSEVEKIKREERPGGLSAQEISRRGGEHASKWYSTVNSWHVKYKAPRADLSIEEEVEALIEGGGIYHDSGYKSGAQAQHAAAQWPAWRDLVYESDDRRLEKSGGLKSPGHLEPPARMSADWRLEPAIGLPIYGSANISAPWASSTRSEVDEQPRRLDQRNHDDEEEKAQHVRQARNAAGSSGKGDSSPLRRRDTNPVILSRQDAAAAAAAPDSKLSARSQRPETEELRVPQPPARVPRPQYAGHLPAPASQGGSAGMGAGAGAVVDMKTLREQRYLVSSSSGAGAGAGGYDSPANLPLRGGTVVVHYLKRDEWFYETALALVGRDRVRAKQAGASGAGAGAGGAGWGTQYTMWGSPDSQARGTLGL